ncbi:MAG: prenyltransferase [Ectothiorhodospiraceae bacterium]|nr:prenyltransferase [Chromatiales bacterium]MCP5154725.1 prenyltransferase [Ectothiorhodospiraceae bacterium]
MSDHDAAPPPPGGLPAARLCLVATRPRFLAASLLPVLVGIALTIGDGAIAPDVLICCVLAVALVHSGANVLNDVWDDATGADVGNDDRISPYTGGSRVIQDGRLSRDAMTRLGACLVATSALPAIWLVHRVGLSVLALGAAGVVLAVVYSAPPLRLCARGLGELVVAVAFGVLPVVGMAWVGWRPPDMAVLLAAAAVAAWVVAVLLANEIPDRRADAASGKHTLVVRLGVDGARALLVAVHLAALAAVAGMWWGGHLASLALVGAAGVASLGLVAAARVGSADRARLRSGIELNLKLHAAGCIGLAAGIAFHP